MTVLHGFHCILIGDFKTTQEKLKKDKGYVSGAYISSPHRYGGNNMCSCCENFSKALCCRRNVYHSKMSWELYISSLGMTEEYDAYVEGQNQRAKDLKQPLPVFLDQIEPEVDLYDPDVVLGQQHDSDSDPNDKKFGHEKTYIASVVYEAEFT